MDVRASVDMKDGDFATHGQSIGRDRRYYSRITHTVANVATRPDQIGSWTVDTHDQMPSLRVHDNCFIDCQPSAQRSASQRRVDSLFWKVEGAVDRSNVQH